MRISPINRIPQQDNNFCFRKSCKSAFSRKRVKQVVWTFISSDRIHFFCFRVLFCVPLDPKIKIDIKKMDFSCPIYNIGVLPYNVVVPDFCAPIIKNEGNAGFEANPSVETNKLKKITLMLLIVITQPFSKLR